MEFLVKAGQLILSLSILIVLHEFGHYLPARWFKTRVEKFYLFFDYKFSLFKKKIKDTEWGIGWIPLGGYVKISGMIDESMDTEQMKEEPKDYEFRTKPAWQRLIIMIGGITVNMIVGILIYWLVLFSWGEDYVAVGDVPHGFEFSEKAESFGFRDGDQILEIEGEVPFSQLDLRGEVMLRGAREVKVLHQDGNEEVLNLPEDAEWQFFESDGGAFMTARVFAVMDTVIAGNNAEAAGFQNGDSIVAVNGNDVTYWSEFSDAMKDLEDQKVQIDFYRNNVAQSMHVHTDTSGKIGVGTDTKKRLTILTQSHKDYSFGEAFSAGIGTGVQTLSDYATQLKFLFSKKGASSIGGFGAFGSMFSAQWDWHSFWLNTAFISIILAFMNFLPIPALDGGHIVFLLYEMVSGRKPNEKVMQYAQMVGIILLLGLVLFANGNDIFKWLSGS